MNPDFEVATHHLRGIIGGESPSRLAWFVHPGAPVSKARARWSRKSGSFYTPSGTATAEQSVSWMFKACLKGEPFLGNIAIIAIFYRPNYQRIDADNLMKLVMDAGTKAGAWADDCQVTAQAAFIELDRKNPRTVIALCPATSSLDRTRLKEFTCKRCGQPFSRDRFTLGHRTHTYCSQACAQATARAEAKCPKCERIFLRKAAGQSYCSKACAASAPRVRRPNVLQRPPSLCLTCGKRVSRREYLHCSDCSPKGRKKGSKNKVRSTDAIDQPAGATITVRSLDHLTTPAAHAAGSLQLEG